jgi:1-acyl-sn-glycerol-3-phosphate acyltransferase
VPVTIDGSHKLIEDKRLKRGKVTVTIHKPIYEKKAVAKDYKEMTEYCRETIESGFE